MLSLETLNKMKAEKSMLRTLENVVRKVSNNQLSVYPYDQVILLDMIEGVPIISVRSTLDSVCDKLQLDYSMGDDIKIWNSADRKQRLMTIAETVKDRMIERIEAEQKRFIDSDNTLFSAILNYNSDYLVLAKEVFEPLGFIITLDGNNDLWVKDPKFVERK